MFSQDCHVKCGNHPILSHFKIKSKSGVELRLEQRCRMEVSLPRDKKWEALGNATSPGYLKSLCRINKTTRHKTDQEIILWKVKTFFFLAQNTKTTEDTSTKSWLRPTKSLPAERCILSSYSCARLHFKVRILLFQKNTWLEMPQQCDDTKPTGWIASNHRLDYFNCLKWSLFCESTGVFLLLCSYICYMSP